MLDKVSSHFPRSPFTHPPGRDFCASSRLSFSLCFFFSSRHGTVPLSTHHPPPQPPHRSVCPPVTLLQPPPPSLTLTLVYGSRWRVFRRSEKPLAADCRNEFYVLADSFIAAGLDDRVNRRGRVLFHPLPAFVVPLRTGERLLSKKFSRGNAVTFLRSLWARIDPRVAAKGKFLPCPSSFGFARAKWERGAIESAEGC